MARKDRAHPSPPPPAPTAHAARWLRPPIALAAIALAAALAYHDSFHGAFVFDDVPAIAENPDIRSFASALRENPSIDTATAVGRPLLRVSLWANYAAGGLDVRGYHALNLVLHVATAWLLWALLRQLFRSPALRARTGAAAEPLAFCIALLWTLHPLQTESVTYIVQRTEILGALFYLATLYGVARCAGSAGRQAGVWGALATLACLLGMAAKETLATAPLVAVALDRIFFATSWQTLWRARGRLYVALASTWIFLAYLVTASAGRRQTVGFDLGMTWWQYALTQPYYVCRYLFLSIWPGPLTLDYGRYHATTVGEVLPYALLVAALVALTAWALRRDPPFGFCGLWFFALLAPTSSVVPIVTQTGAEHRMYLPLAAVIAAAVVGAYALAKRARGPTAGRLALAAFAVVALAFGARTIARNADYRSNVTIWESAIAHWPRNPRAHMSLGAVLASQGLTAESIPHFERAIELRPDYVDAQVDLATALAKLGRTKDAIAQLETVLRRHPDLPEANNNLGNMLLKEGRLEEAIDRFQRAIRSDPNLAEALNNWGNALSRAGRHADAIARYRQALAARPELAEAHFNLGRALLDTGRPGDAIPHYEAALRLGPVDAAMHAGLADALARANRLPEAILQYEAALRLEPEQPDLLNNLAWLYATDPDLDRRRPDEAVRLAERAVALGGDRNPSLLDTLAAAYASAGRFPEAVATAERAIALARDAGEAEAARQLEAHAALYRAGQPYAAP